MEGAITNLARFLRLVGRLEMYASVCLIVLMTLSVFLQVVSRYGFNMPLRWVEEVGIAALVWVTFLAGSLAYKEEIHIRIFLPFQASGGILKRLPVLIVDALIGVCALMVVLIARPVIAVESLTPVSTLAIDLPKAWFFSIPVLAGFASILASSVFFVARDLARLFGLSFAGQSIAPFGSAPSVGEV